MLLSSNWIVIAHFGSHTNLEVQVNFLKDFCALNGNLAPFSGWGSVLHQYLYFGGPTA